MVHGFDVPYDEERTFKTLAEGYREKLDRVGVSLVTVKTNSKHLGLQSWEDSFLSELSACLHQFDHEFGRALVGSSEPYNFLLAPWGSSPLTDHLLSGDKMQIVHDGASYSRTEKVEALAKEPSLVEGIKVCWQGADPSKNCGSCEKCLRTRLNFAAVGCNNPPCFSSPLQEQMLSRLTFKNLGQLREAESILSYMNKKGISSTWKATLKRKILMRKPFLILLERLKPSIVKIAERFHIKQKLMNYYYR